MKFYYINSKGIRINFYDYPYLFQSGNLMNYSWECSGETKIEKISKRVSQRTFKVAVIPDLSLPLEERKQLLKHYADGLFEVFEYDVIKKKNGMLCTDSGYCLPCRVTASDKETYNFSLPYVFNSFTAVTESDMWFKNVSKSFYAQNAIETYSNDSDFPYDYEYDYATAKSGVAFWNIGHFDSSDFELIVYGAVINPLITINGHEYIVYTSVNENERLIINSKDNTCYKITNSGVTLNCYDLRGKKQSVFKKLPSGALTINWNGLFRFDITAMIERSEPSWN